MDGCRQFSLFPREVLVAGRSVYGAHFEARVPLATLEPTISRLFVRTGFFWFGWTLAGGSGLVCLVLASLSPAVSWSFWPIWVIIALGIGGVVLLGMSWRKVEFAQFRSQAGVTVLDVARAGPQRGQFDTFLDALAREIQNAKGKA